MTIDWVIRVAVAVYISGAVVALARQSRAVPVLIWRIVRFRRSATFAVTFTLGLLVSTLVQAALWPIRAKRLLWPKPPIHKGCGEPTKDHFFRCPCCMGYVAPGPHGAPEYACCRAIYSGPLIIDFIRDRHCRKKALPWAFDVCTACERPRCEHDLRCPSCGERHPAPDFGATWKPCCELDDADLVEVALKRPCPGVWGGQCFEGPDIEPHPSHFVVLGNLGGELDGYALRDASPEEPVMVDELIPVGLDDDEEEEWPEGVCGWEVLCPDGLVRNYPYHNLGDAESHAEFASDPKWFTKRRCRLAPRPSSLELSLPECPGGEHVVRPIMEPGYPPAPEHPDPPVTH